mgnify:CR=1 FL=1
MEAYRTQHQALPATLTDLVVAGAFPSLPQEPFGGDYRLDPKTRFGLQFDASGAAAHVF